MKKNIFILSFILLKVVLLGQDKKTTIKIRKIKWNVSISPNDSILWVNAENPIQINVKGGNNYCVNIKDGKIKCNGNKYILRVAQEGAVTLTVYEKLPNKKMKTLYTKLYQAKKVPEPIAYVCGVKSDSVIDKQQIINDNIVTAIYPFYKLQPPIVGFDMIATIGGKTDTLTSTNNHFTIDMRRRIYYLTSGSILYFNNIYYLMPNGKVQKMKPFGIYITETNKYKVGYSVNGL